MCNYVALTFIVCMCMKKKKKKNMNECEMDAQNKLTKKKKK